uniref:ANK_REP_REGION domain-containing protein n=1 Tax=Hydatigena taeniaeformis TaxID=6205 RepID=A0A0R3WWM4_HYDTA
LSQAICANDAARVEQLLRLGVSPFDTWYIVYHQADPEVYGEDDTTSPLIEATLRGFAEVVKTLLLHGASPSHTDVINNTALHWAIATCHWNCLMLLLNHGSPLEAANYRLRTPLMQAAFYGHERVVQHLIDRGAKVDRPLNGNKESALTISCEMGDVDITKILLNVGNRSHDQGRQLYIALSRAAFLGHIEVVQLLLAQGAEVNRCEDDIEAPIFAAVSRGHSGILKLLIAHHGNIEERNKMGYTPLMLATQLGAEAMVTELIDAGANIDAVANNGRETALLIARTHGQWDVEKVILAALARSRHS